MHQDLPPNLFDDRPLHHLAELQHGLITADQVAELGWSRGAWRALPNRGWEPLTRRVLRRRGAPRTPSQRVLAAIYDRGEGTHASGPTAAALWGVPGFRADPVHVIVVRDGRETPSTLSIGHRPRYLPDPFAALLDGIPVCRPALVVLHLAPAIHPDRLRRVVDNLWSRRLLSGPSLAEELAPVLGRGRPGTKAVRELLASFPDGYVPPASGLEGRFASILERAGERPMRRQVDLGDPGRWAGRVDFVDDALPLVVEVDSERYHSALSDVADDRRRQVALESAGFVVVRVTDLDLWGRPAAVVDAVRAARRRLRRARSVV